MNGTDHPDRSPLAAALQDVAAPRPGESPAQMIARAFAPGATFRNGGQDFDAAGYAAHVDLLHATFTDGEAVVLEEVEQPTGDGGRKIAGRYLFRGRLADGAEVAVESHVFARVTSQGLLRRLVGVDQPLAPGQAPPT